MKVKGDIEANGGAEANSDAEASSSVEKERRRSPRYECSGEAQMRIPPHVTTSKGDIIDLSFEGCRIEFSAPQKLERNQRVELLFNINNLPFHVLAVVRSKRSLRDFGFEFPQMLDRARAQLQALIDEIKTQEPKPEPTSKPEEKRGRVIPIQSYRLR